MKRLTALLLTILLLLSLAACGGKDSWQEQYDLGMRYLNEGSYQEAIIAFTAAIEIDEKRPEAYLGRGRAYVLSGETDENLNAARSDFEKALELDPSYVDAWLDLADIYIRLGDYDSAEETLRRGYETTESLEISQKMEQLAEIRKSEFYWASFIGKPLREISEYLGESYTTVWWGGYAAEFSDSVIAYCETSYENLEPSDEDIVCIVVPGEAAPIVKGLTTGMTYQELIEAVGMRVNLDEPTYEYEGDSWAYIYSLAFELDGYNIQYIWEDDPYQTKSVYESVSALPDEIVLTQDEAEKLAQEYCGYAQGDVDPWSGYKLYLTYDEMQLGKNPRKNYYVFRMQWLVPPDFHPSTIGFIKVDAKTGECMSG